MSNNPFTQPAKAPEPAPGSVDPAPTPASQARPPKAISDPKAAKTPKAGGKDFTARNALGHATAGRALQPEGEISDEDGVVTAEAISGLVSSSPLSDYAPDAAAPLPDPGDKDTSNVVTGVATAAVNTPSGVVLVHRGHELPDNLVDGERARLVDIGVVFDSE